jgi:short-subunit dehydrogenase
MTIAITGRDISRLKQVGADCEVRGATVVSKAVDVTDHRSLSSWFDTLETHHPLDLLIVNAGVFTGHGADGSLETAEEIAWQIRTNLEGAANTINAALPYMRRRRNGHIAVIGSLAALQPLADAPGYSASKAGVMSYGEALREYLIEEGITVTLVYPGHIETAQVADHVGALPLLVTAEKAAAIIKRGLDRRRTFIAFPRRLLWLIRAGRALPWRIRAALGGDFRFKVRKGTPLDN